MSPGPRTGYCCSRGRMRSVPQWVVGVAILVHLPLYYWSTRISSNPSALEGEAVSHQSFHTEAPEVGL